MSLEKNISRKEFLEFMKKAALVSAMSSINPSILFSKETDHLEWGQARTASFEEIAGINDFQTELFQYEKNPNIYIIDFGGKRSLENQGSTMNRLAAYIEKKGAPKDRLLNDSELDEFIKKNRDNKETFYLGHDYRASDLIRFFISAEKQKIELNKEEENLKKVLIMNKFMKKKSKGDYEIITPLKALISFPEEQYDNPATPQYEEVSSELRKTILSHELSHGEYFTNKIYQTYCEEFWKNSFSDNERKKFRTFLDDTNYDSKNEDLMINEMQANLIHTPFKWFQYGTQLPIERLKELKKEFLSNSPIESYLN